MNFKDAALKPFLIKNIVQKMLTTHYILVIHSTIIRWKLNKNSSHDWIIIYVYPKVSSAFLKYKTESSVGSWPQTTMIKFFVQICLTTCRSAVYVLWTKCTKWQLINKTGALLAICESLQPAGTCNICNKQSATRDWRYVPLLNQAS